MEWLSVANAAINGIVIGMLLALPALAITLVFGIARFPNAATGDYMTLGAYATVASQAFLGGSVVTSVLGAMSVTAIVSLFFYFWVFRALAERSQVARLIASIGVAFAVRSTITFFAGQDQHVVDVPLVRAWNFGGIRLLPTDLYILATAVTALVIVFCIMHLTPTGRRMRAIADNAELVTGAFCGLGGALLGIKAVVVPELGWELLMPMFAGVILGGIGSPVGAVLGIVTFSIAQEVASLFAGPPYKIVFAFVILLCVLLLRPQGMFGRPMAAR
ncbi:MAG: branched-chain amino acid transporter permease [Microvirga sp.]|nr:branched-chain amino acid transporter permease [Microvirga sp.]